MLNKISFLSLFLISSSVLANPTNIKSNLYDEQLLNRLRGKFIISGASNFYYPDFKYGGYLIPKEHIDNNLCKNKMKGSFYLIDHEGGNVKRIPSNTPTAKKSLSLKVEDYQSFWSDDMATIKSYCIDAILGPTVDIGMGDGRSYSSNLEYNFKSIQPLLETSKKSNVLSVVKHFPGLLLRCDRQGKSKEQNICNEDLQFIDKLWGKNLDNYSPKAIMISHYYYKTTKNHPALANEEILGYLRSTKNYNGVIITDSLWELNNTVSDDEALNMYKYTDLILLMDYKKIERMIRYLHHEIKKNPSLESYLIDSEKRIEAWKKK